MTGYEFRSRYSLDITSTINVQLSYILSFGGPVVDHSEEYRLDQRTSDLFSVQDFSAVFSEFINKSECNSSIILYVYWIHVV